MAFPPELIAEIKRRNPYATDEMIAEIEKRWGDLPTGPSVGGQLGMAAAGMAGNYACCHVGQGLLGTSAQTMGHWLPVAGNAYNAYDISKNDKMTKEQKAQAMMKETAMAVANFFTFGLAGGARGLVNRTGMGREGERWVDKHIFADPTKGDYWKDPSNYLDVSGWEKVRQDPTRLITNPPMTSMPIVGLAAKGLSGVMGGLGTKEKQQQRAYELMQKGVTGYPEFYGMTKIDADLYDKAFGKLQEGARGARSDLDAAFVGMDDKSGRWINNAFANSGKAEDLRPEDVWGSEGVFSTFGNDWLGKYTEDQRRQISQTLLDQALFKLDHGDAIISDKNKALDVRNQILGGDQGVPTFGPTQEEKQKLEEEKQNAN